MADAIGAAGFNARLDGRYFTPIAVLTFSGTWAPPGSGYPTDVVRRLNPALFFEVPVIAPWTMGGIQGHPNDPSYWDSIHQGKDWAIGWLQNYAGPFILAGYSQGAHSLMLVEEEILTGTLQHRRKQFLGGYTFGNPMRPKDIYVGSRNPGGRGIADEVISEVTPNLFHYANVGDFYTTVPDNGLVGEDIRDVYRIVIHMQIGNFGEFVGELMTQGQKIVDNVMGLVLNPVADIPPALDAAVRALTFYAQGTGPHITYHSAPVPGDQRDSLTHAVDTWNHLGPRLLPAENYGWIAS
jgi:hypothetical protein